MQKTNIVALPHAFKPRGYQNAIMKQFDLGKRRIIQCWHRRGGKDKTDFNLMVREAYKRVGNYYYLGPKYTQIRKIIWDNIDKTGFRMLNHIPKAIIKKEKGQYKINNSELKVELINGSTIQCIGGDDVDKIVGTNPCGIVFTEFSLTNPKTWQLLRPILLENKGWAIFNFTPRGKNHAYKLLQAVIDSKSWYVDIRKADETGVFTAEELEEEKRLMRLETGDDALFNQEYMCSFEAAVQGSYYGEIMANLEESGHICNVPYDPNLLVYTAWDLGVNDQNVIWFYQIFRNEIRFIDYYEDKNKGLNEYVAYCRSKGYVFGKAKMPHDIAVREYSTAQPRSTYLDNVGFEYEIVPLHKVQDGIDAVRRILPLCYFDKTKCSQGIEALINYHKEYDEDRHVFKNGPEHDWASHPADAFRQMAMSTDSLSLNTKEHSIEYRNNLAIIDQAQDFLDEFDRFSTKMR